MLSFQNFFYKKNSVSLTPMTRSHHIKVTFADMNRSSVGEVGGILATTRTVCNSVRDGADRTLSISVHLSTSYVFRLSWVQPFISVNVFRINCLFPYYSEVLYPTIHQNFHENIIFFSVIPGDNRDNRDTCYNRPVTSDDTK